MSVELVIEKSFPHSDEHISQKVALRDGDHLEEFLSGRVLRLFGTGYGGKVESIGGWDPKWTITTAGEVEKGPNTIVVYDDGGFVLFEDNNGSELTMQSVKK